MDRQPTMRRTGVAARTRSRLGQALLRAQTDERLAALARDGSPAAFAVLADRYRAELTGQARRLAGAQAADDVVQQTLTSAWAALRSGAQIRQPRAWLHQIARHAAFGAQRRPADAGESALREIPCESAEERYLQREGAREALAAMAALPERQRRALELTALHGASARGAARELGLNENALRQAVHRARSSVRRAASAATPYPLLHWALPAGGAETISTVAASAGAGTAALALKGTAAVVAVGVGLGGTAALLHPGRLARGPHPAEANALAKPRATSGPASAGGAQIAVRELGGPDARARVPATLVSGASAGSTSRLRRHAGSVLGLSRRTETGRRSHGDGAHREGSHRGAHGDGSRGDGSRGSAESDRSGGPTSHSEPSGDTQPSFSSPAGKLSTDSSAERGDPTPPSPSSPAAVPQSGDLSP
jgi:RNA polymerase sigma factor (sigma-70 family)